MVQFYFLSIVANILGGTALAEDYLSDKLPALNSVREWLGKRGTKAAIGLFAGIVGLLKLIIRPVGDMVVPVAGDLLPALVGIGIGATLLLDVFRERVSVSGDLPLEEQKALVPYRIPLGLAGIAVSILHFFLPGALFL